ncbi:MAG: hypothetical protein LBT66_04620 [Methanobrevibacter sp.]|nr:hypothetical protein [Candidatus Methanovirga meridionalis]
MINDVSDGNIYNVITPRLRGDTNYTVTVKAAIDTYNVNNSNVNNIITKIRPKFIVSNTGNSNGNIGFAKDVAFNNYVTYKLVNENDNIPLANQSVKFVGLITTHTNYSWYWDWKAQLDNPNGLYYNTTSPFNGVTNENGIINLNYNAFGNYDLSANIVETPDIITENYRHQPLHIIKLAGERKHIITHTASSGGSATPSHWTTDNNGFDFSADPNWALGFISETRIWFYDLDGNQIGNEEHFTLDSGDGNKHIMVPANAATMDIECGIKNGGDHTTKKGIEAGKAAINYDGTALNQRVQKIVM